MNVSFNDENRAEFERLLTRYPEKEAVILPSLHLVQKQYGHVPDEGIVYVAQLLGLSPARIQGVATFYTMYNRKPVGKYHVQICRNIACSVMGAEHLIDHVSRKLGVKHYLSKPFTRDAFLGALRTTMAELAAPDPSVPPGDVVEVGLFGLPLFRCMC